ncbi:MAG: pyridoxal phosphate-dependent aminotransferase [Candidatus Nitrosopelagicus sp.]|jgi:aspartate/methionine/tyrosine aminotransferase|nr:pyridoxal phosphate-dependent aminotransferase [Candidatus Nitrosopelagicus sp.]|tara:strand:- start:4843 stop:6018 length:1176 start_codon:yes stop_codon:yes gene_type:complete
MRELSDLSNRTDGQPMFKLLDKVKKLEVEGKEIIHFEIGDPDFRTPENISNAGIKAIKNGFTHYVSSSGLTEFRQKICETTEVSRGFKPNIDQVLVTPGANIAIFYAISCIVNPGEEVIVPDPGFPTYFSTIKMCNTKAVHVPLLESNKFRMNPKDIENSITEKTRMIIINSPQNPTGSVMTKEEIRMTYEIAEKHDLYLYSDEIYARMVYKDSVFNSPSVYDKCQERTIISNGFSKAFAMTGWRLGAVIGPSNVVEKMKLLLETTSSCVPPFIQKAGIEAIEGEQTSQKSMYDEYEQRRNIVVDGINSIHGLSCITPGGAFYVFINIKKTGMTSESFCDYILEDAGVAILPGTSFGEFGEGFVRICYAVNQDKIKNALERIKKSISKLDL